MLNISSQPAKEENYKVPFYGHVQSIEEPWSLTLWGLALVSLDMFLLSRFKNIAYIVDFLQWAICTHQPE